MEGELLSALRRLGAAEDAKACNFQVASRTDRGVSALGNVVAISTEFAPGALLRALNAELDGIWAWEHAAVPDRFNPRHAWSRWYRYHLSAGEFSIERLKRAADELVGEHDFSRFARLAGKDPLRRLDAVDVRASESIVLLDFRAPNFLWNMVRRLVWALVTVGKGELELAELQSALRGAPLRSGLAPPEPLVLMDVDVGISFTTDRQAAAAARKSLEGRLRDLAVRQAFYDAALKQLGS